MKQLTRSEFNKRGTTYKSVTSPATDNEVTQITDIVVKNNHLSYSTNGSTFTQLTDEVQFVTDLSEVYPSTSEFPTMSASDDGTIYVAMYNSELPLSLYRYNGTTSEWEFIDNVRPGVLYYDEASGLINVFTETSPYFSVTSYTKTSQLTNDANFVDSTELATELATKQDTLTTAQQNTVDSGITSALVTQIGTNQSNISDLQLNKQDAIDSLNMLDADYVDDSTSTNKFVTTTDINTWDAKQDALSQTQLDAVNSGIDSTLVTQIGTNQSNITGLQSSKQDVIDSTHKLDADLVDDTSTSNKFVTATEKETWNAKQNALTQTQLDAVNSGVTSATVSQVATNTTNIAAKYTKPSGGIPKSDLAQGVQDSLGLADSALQSISSSDVTTALGYTPYNSTNPNGYTKVESSSTNGNIKINGSETTVYTLPNNIATTSDVTAVSNRVTTIEGEIPSQASSSNQLADKAFVNSSINALAAYYITKNAVGDPFATKAELTAATTFYSGGVVRVPTTNDYCIVLADESKQSSTGVDPTTRYTYQGSQWEYQYTINDTPLTAAQLAALNSGITSSLVTQIGTNTTDIAGKQDTIDSSHKLDADLVDDTSTTNKFVTSTDISNWNGKQNALSTTQMNAVNSGVTSSTVSQVSTNTSDISGLQSSKQNAITSSAKLDADLVDDSTSTNKFVTSSDITTWNAKQDALTTAQMNAVDSGVTSSTVSQVATNTSDISGLQSSKQDAITSSAKLSADLVDDASTTNKFVTSSDITNWNAKQNALTFDTTPTSASTNPVTSGGVYTALADKADTSSLATVATSGSYNDLTNKPTIPTTTSSVTQDSTAALTSGGAYTALSGKQDTLTAGTGITITNNVISSTATIDNDEKVQEISTQYVRITDLDAGVYRLTYNGTKYIYYNGASATDTHTVTGADGEVILVVSMYSTSTRHWYYINGSSSYASIYFGYTTSTAGNVASKSLNDVVTSATTSSITSGSTALITSGGVYTGMQDKMDKANPTGTGALSLNRKANTTVGTNSVAEGSSTTASGNDAHAEGDRTTASATASHAEGDQTTASGNYSHAEGSHSTASGYLAHAEGRYTTARRRSQHVFGEFNVLDTGGVETTSKGSYIEIVGNGTASDALSNARTLDWSGNEVLAGTLKTSGFVDGNNANYKLVMPDSTSWTADKTIATTDQITSSSTDVQINGTSITSNDVANIVTNTAYNASTNKIATMSDIPTVNNATLSIQLNGNTINSFTANASSNVTANIQALPNYSITINHNTAGNPRQVKFLSVNYTNYTSNSAAYFKMGAMSCHGNGTSYQFLEDIIIGVTSGGSITAQLYKYCQASTTLDSVTRYYGDVFYTIDTTAKVVDFYILCGQYASSQFTPFTKIGSTTTSGITQYSGTATYYSSGTKTWFTGCGTTYVRGSDLATVATTGSYDDLTNKPTIPSAVTSIDGLAGGTLTSPLTITGGDSATASKIILNTNGQITDTATATLFGRSGTGSTLLVGHGSYALTMRGSATRPTYNGNSIALSSDIPTKTSELQNDSGFLTSAPVSSVAGYTGAVTSSNLIAAILTGAVNAGDKITQMTKSSIGSITFASGLKIKWGTITAGQPASGSGLTFAGTAFSSSTSYQIVLAPLFNSNSGSGGFWVKTKSTTGFTAAATSGFGTIQYIAIGY